MKTATKAQVREAAATSEVAVTVAPAKAKKARAPKTVEQALTTEIGSAAPSTKPAKAAKAVPAPFIGPLPAPAANVAPAASQADLYAMPAGVETRPGTRKAAVYDAMCAISPATRADLIAAAEMAEQEWRAGTKRLEAPKPGAKWFRRFAPLAEGNIKELG